MYELIDLTVAVAGKFWNGLGAMNGQASFLLGVLLCFIVMRYLIRLGIIVVLVLISLALAGTPVGFAALAQNFPSIATWLGEDVIAVLEDHNLIDETVKEIGKEIGIDLPIGDNTLPDEGADELAEEETAEDTEEDAKDTSSNTPRRPIKRP